MAFALFWRNRQICCKQKITGHSTTGQIQDSPLQGKSVGANGIHPINGTKPPESPFFKGGFFCGVRFKSNHPPTPSLNRKEGEQPVGANLVFARSTVANPPESPFFKGGLFCGVRFKSNHPPTPSLKRRRGSNLLGRVSTPPPNRCHRQCK